MPFFGRDWRSPGEVWIKTDDGWERMKILESTRLNTRRENLHDLHGFNSSDSSTDSSDSENENLDDNIIERLKTNATTNSSPILSDDQFVHLQPYCHVTLKPTKEVAGYNTISEAFYRLDFCNAIRDIRRFNYISKLLHLLITQNLTSLSGCATKVLFTMLEQLAWQVASNQQNIHILHTLLYDLKKIMRKYYCWGRPLGSTILWQQHLRTIERICQMANRIEIKQPADDGSKRLTDLPEELIREILLRLTDYKDLMNSGQSYDIMQSILDEQHIWKQLCKYHFTRQQIRYINSSSNKKAEKIDWEQTFHQIRKKFGLKEEYADCLFLCRHCRCLFWKSYGHPCVVDNQVNQSKDFKVKGSIASPQHPVIVQNIPFFHHPLVQHHNNNDHNNEQHNNDNDDDNAENVNRENDMMVPQHVPIPPQAFLKFFSL